MPEHATADTETTAALDARLDAHSKRMDDLEGTLDDVQAQLADEREERRRLEAENDRLQEEIDQLHSRTDLLRLVENSDEMTAKQRRIALIQHLKKAAERERERGREAKASVNKAEAEAALQYPDISRPMFYDDLREAPKLIGDESLLWYDTNAGGESRLRLNLEHGSLPSSLRGEADQ